MSIDQAASLQRMQFENYHFDCQNSKLIIDNMRHHPSEKMIILSYMILFLTFICRSILLVVGYILEIEPFVVSIG